MDLIGTPLKLAELQHAEVNDPQSIEHTVLKTVSLACSAETLFNTYQEEVKKIMGDARRKARAMKFFERRLKDFQERWPRPFNRQAALLNIKTEFVELLHHLLGDMALFCGITATNTLDIINELVQWEVFTPNSGVLLKESISAIYTTRMRLHQLYRAQREEAKAPQVQALDSSFLSLTSAEVLELEKCHDLVLKPLYHQLTLFLMTGKRIKASWAGLEDPHISQRPPTRPRPARPLNRLKRD